MPPAPADFSGKGFYDFSSISVKPTFLCSDKIISVEFNVASDMETKGQALKTTLISLMNEAI